MGPGKNVVYPVNTRSSTVSITLDVTQHDGIFQGILREPNDMSEIREFASLDGTQEYGRSSSKPINFLCCKPERPGYAQKLSNTFVFKNLNLLFFSFLERP